MKTLYIIFSVLVLSSLTSCYEEEYFLDDNSTSENKHFPVVQSVVVEGEVDEDSSINLLTHYWSQDPIDHYELYSTVEGGEESLVLEMPYQYNFDEEAGSELVSLPYTIPSSTSGKTIDFRVLIVNQNGLSKDRTTSITVN
ncbi:hypothetical protein [Fulvivirga ligni]|uniref:hypothetical protein n=1 Tax=Fulvivirga ligni TaxID=2904246 RepID=UPI001F2D1C12|nr:hypothetical protein [Fulvivirga ligni]UII23589.1 hypothetical protein LVD16_10155 [Fulvivirga ligni]